ncbi:MAG TPA: HAMP domain-containing sensor histidine kinase [Salinivirgaceae bacterium]|nr:HAMP domain-containing sensor histidine kinase [Salinivirgaceae bacterium]
MDFYSKKRRWKYVILLMAIFVGCGSLIYSNYLVGKLKQEERRKMELYALAIKKFAENDDFEADMSLVTEIITQNTTIPLILTDETDSILAFVNFPAGYQNNLKLMYHQLEKIKQNREPIIIQLANKKTQKVYYKDSTLLTLLFWYPIVQIFIFLVFIGLAYMAFSNSRKAEQNRVWAGMAKETAHQLGTPISSLMAWVEILNDIEDAKPHMEHIRQDVERLNVIANRFSKIGSIPDLQPKPIGEVIQNAIHYMKFRTTNRIIFELKMEIAPETKVNLNESLFEWVLENLVRNAIDAMMGAGKITILVQNSDKKIILDISDEGKGIPKKYHKTVFSPGYTTKPRGWGLGLSLSKRIIEEYHNGKIFVKLSEPGGGTTIRIILPIQPE